MLHRRLLFALLSVTALPAQAAFEVHRLMPGARSEFAFVHDVVRGESLVFGDERQPGDRSMWSWNGQRWREIVPTGASPLPCLYVAATSNPLTGACYLFGGMSAGQVQNTLWRWDGTNWTAFAGPGPSPRLRTALACDPATGDVYLFGGVNPNNFPLNDLWRWNGTTWQAITGGPAPAARYSHAMTWDPGLGSNGGLLVHGGDSYWTGPVGNCWEWTAASGWTQQGGVTPPANHGHGMCYDAARGRVILLAYAPAGTSQTWEWDGNNWQQLTPGTAPEARQFGGLCYDTTRQRVLLYGGGGTTSAVGSYTVWSWDGVAWTRELVEPEGRTWTTTVYDEARDRLVLTMGSYHGPLAPASLETWEHAGALQQLAVTNPPARTGHHAWYDRTRQRTVLHGGRDKFGNYLHDTWEFDGTSWTQRSSVMPAPDRVAAAIAYDPGRNRAVLFGGAVSASFQDTWEWDGAAWSQRFPPNVPPSRANHCMAYDPISQRVILFGGASYPGQIALADTWAFDGTDWQALSPTTVPPANFTSRLVLDRDRQRLVLLDRPASATSSFGFQVFDWTGSDWLARGPVAAFFGAAPGYLTDRGRLLVVHDSGFRTELALPLADLGPADAVGDLQLTCSARPALGSVVSFDATSPVNGPMFAAFSFAPSQVASPLPGPFCLPSSTFLSQLAVLLPMAGTSLPVTIPTAAALAFLPTTVQVLELRSPCLAVSNGLQLRVQP